MANREIGTAPLVVYLLAWWGFVLAAFLWLTSNQAPGAPELKFKEAQTFVTSKLAVEIAKPAVDPDGDIVEYAYTWRKNGELVADEEASAVSQGQIRAGETWEVTVEPNDGSKDSFACGLFPSWRTCAGETVAKAEVVIANTPPQARIRVQDAKGEDVAALTGSDLSLVLACYDPDLIQKDRDAEAAAAAAGTTPPPPAEGTTPAEKPDPCSYKIAWYAGDAPAIVEPGAAPAEPAPAPADGAAAPAEPPTPKFTDVRTVSAKDLKASKIWRVHVIASDGEVEGPIAEVVLEPPPAE